MSDRYGQLREEIALGDGMGMDDALAEQVGALLAERDALAKRNAKLVAALREHTVFTWTSDETEAMDGGGQCLVCKEEWAESAPERHRDDCLAALQSEGGR